MQKGEDLSDDLRQVDKLLNADKEQKEGGEDQQEVMRSAFVDTEEEKQIENQNSPAVQDVVEQKEVKSSSKTEVEEPSVNIQKSSDED